MLGIDLQQGVCERERQQCSLQHPQHSASHQLPSCMDVITDHMPSQRSEEEAGTVCICIFFLNVCMHVCTLHECSLPGGQKRALYSLELEMVRYHVVMCMHGMLLTFQL